MRPHIFKFTLKSGKVITVKEWFVSDKKDALNQLYSMFKYKPTIVGFYSN